MLVIYESTSRNHGLKKCIYLFLQLDNFSHPGHGKHCGTSIHSGEQLCENVLKLMYKCKKS